MADTALAPSSTPAQSCANPPGPKAKIALLENSGEELYEAAAQGDLDKVRALCLEWAGNESVLNWSNSGGDTPLNIACWYDHCEVVSALIGTAGVNVNMANINCCSPLWVSAANGSTNTVRVLLSAKDRGLDLNQKNNHGDTPLRRARENNNNAVVTLLEEAGATEEGKAFWWWWWRWRW